MKRIKRAFTLIEIVVTIAILGISSAMATMVILNISQAQNASSDQYSFNNQIDGISKLVKEYVSYVSLDTSDNTTYGITLSYDSEHSSSTQLVFVDNNSATYSLTYSENRLSIQFSEDAYCENQSVPVSIPDVSNYQIAFDDEINLVKVKYLINGKENHVSGVVRT